MARLLLVLILFGAAVWAAANPVGTWDCTAQTPDGDNVPWTLVVAQEGGKLVATLKSTRGDFKVPQTAVDGDTLTFSVTVGGEGTFEIRLTFAGDTMQGTWKGSDSSGKMKGRRRAA